MTAKAFEVLIRIRIARRLRRACLTTASRSPGAGAPCVKVRDRAAAVLERAGLVRTLETMTQAPTSTALITAACIPQKKLAVFRYSGFWQAKGHVQGQDYLRPHGKPRRVPVDDLEEPRLILSMLSLRLSETPGPLDVLCIGAHSDDIEIGCAGTLLSLVDQGYKLRVTWAVLSAKNERAAEATHSASQLLGNVAELRIHLGPFRDAHFPAQFSALKDYMTDLRRETNPDLIFTHCIDDRHQDHRLVGDLTWQSWRDHLVLEYEVPKYEGDLGRPNFFFPLSRAAAKSKVDHLLAHFGSQRSKDWFTGDTFLGLMRLRGIECRSADGFAEAFVARKVLL